MTAKRWLLAVLAAALLIGAAACSRARSDAQIAGEVVTKINADPQVSNKQIAVTANNGVVTLSGPAASETERTAAANDAAQIPGVKTVVNNLTAAAPAAPQQASVEDPQPTEPTPPPAPARPRKPAAYRERQHATRANYDKPIDFGTPAPAQMASNNVAPATVSVPATPPPPEPPKPVTIPSGTTLSVRMIDSIDTGRNHPGDMFHASVYAPITIDDKVIIPEGADVTGRIVDLKDAGRFAGQPELALELASVSMNGRNYSIVTDKYHQQGKSRGTNTAKKVGTGAAIGAVIGAIAGGGKGAAIGAATGAGVGGGVQAATKPQQVHIAPEALLSFRLENPLTVTPVASVERNHVNTTWSAPPPRNNVIDYSDNSTGDRPVLKRRPPESNPPQN